MPNIFGRNIIELAALRGMTLRELARRSGTSSGGLTQLINRDKNTARATTIASIAAALDVDPQDMDMPGAAAKYSRIETRRIGHPVPLINPRNLEAWKAIWTKGDLEEGSARIGVDNWLPSCPSNIDDEELVATTVIGDAMSPALKDGDIVYIRSVLGSVTQNESEWKRSIEYRSGDIVLAWPKQKENEERKPPILRAVITSEDGSLWLKATNPDYPGEKVVEAGLLIGCVVGMFRRLD